MFCLAWCLYLWRNLHNGGRGSSVGQSCKKKKKRNQTNETKQTNTKTGAELPSRYLRYTLLLAVDLSLVSLTPVFVHGFFLTTVEEKPTELIGKDMMQTGFYLN